MLKGYNLPLTPTGKSSINPPPPWHYSSDFLDIEFWADPDAVAAVLPEGLAPDPSAAGHANALFFDWQFSGSNEEYLEPARYQYREFFILVDALWNGTPVAFCPYIFVDNDAALARGWDQGFPKRIGSVFQTRSFAAPSAASPKLGPGGKFAGVASSCGQRIAIGRVELEKAVAKPPAGRPTVNLRHFPRLAAGQHDNPAVHELVMASFDDLRIEDAWIGHGHLELPVCDGEEISALAPLRCGSGTRASMSYSVTDLKTLRDYTASLSVR
jgi:acetoacetate decarboxylase